jgi:hypothetical protein
MSARSILAIPKVYGQPLHVGLPEMASLDPHRTRSPRGIVHHGRLIYLEHQASLLMRRSNIFTLVIVGQGSDYTFRCSHTLSRTSDQPVAVLERTIGLSHVEKDYQKGFVPRPDRGKPSR